jgi:threonine dehydratase
MPIVPLNDIYAAQSRIAGHLQATPMLHSRTLADLCGATAFSLKCESLQKTGSFKVRGALNAVSQLDDAARARGVITVSAGNHAQGLAWAARSIGVRCTVVMPATASKTKAAASAGYGAEVILHGTSAEAFVKASALAAEKGYTLIPPFDHRDVMCGAGTVGLEIMKQVREVDVVVVPIGGGGLLSGVGSAVKQINPKVILIGVEPTGAAAMHQSLAAGHPVTLAKIDTIADGLGAPFAGQLTYPIIRDIVDDVVLVTDDEIAAAMALILSRCKLLAEPAGAAATAALIAGKVPQVAGKRVVAILSGGNVDLDRLKSLI